MTERQQALRRIQRIEVEGLFGIYDHQIDLKSEGVTLLHGPNGVGKTSILKMTDALLSGRLTYFHGVPCDRFLLGFQDGSALSLTPSADKMPFRRLFGRGQHASDGEKESRPFATLELAVNGKRESGPVFFDIHYLAAQAAMRVDYLDRVSEDAWIDSRDGEMLTSTAVLRRYGKPLDLFVADTPSSGQDLPWLGTFLEGVNSHLIEAQRLVRMRREHSRISSRARESMPISTVDDCSRDLKRRIDDTVAEYGRQARELDQSFPQRLLQRKSADLSVAEIRDQMAALDRTTEELKNIGILDDLPTNPFEIVDEIDGTQRGVMTLYVEDTARKHQAALHLAERIRQLLKGLNSKFRYKNLAVERDKGLVAKDKHGRTLPLASLSSGEQHELVLQYDLLFRIEPSALVLLDEPEISLHVEWQSTFLADLMEIAELSGFDALVATHSPYIVGERDDLMVGLGRD